MILALNKNEPLIAVQVIKDINQVKQDGDTMIRSVFVKRLKISQHENLQRHWDAFNQHKEIHDKLSQEMVSFKVNKIIKSKFKPDTSLDMVQVY